MWGSVSFRVRGFRTVGILGILGGARAAVGLRRPGVEGPVGL